MEDYGGRRQSEERIPLSMTMAVPFPLWRPAPGLELLGEEWVWNGRSVGEPVEGAAKRVWEEAATLRHVCTIETAYGHAVHAAAERDSI